MKKSIALTVAVVLSMAFAMVGCKSWAPNQTDDGKCSVDRQWVAPKQDAATGEWKDGYCEWLPGKAG